MRTSLKKTVIASLAALTFGLGVVATASPASAAPVWPHGHSFGGHWHGGGGGWHGGHGGWGPGVGLGVLGALAVGGMIAAQQNDECVQYRPTYDAWGNYMGRRPVNVC